MPHSELYILEIAARTAQLSRKAGKKIPAYYPTYPKVWSNYQQLKVHTTKFIKGQYPADLFAQRSPNETEQERKWRQGNFKQITLPVYQDYTNLTTKPLQENNFSIEYGTDEQAVEFKHYVENEIYKYGSVQHFMKSVVPTIKGQDANGVIAIRPNKSPIEFDDDGNQKQIDDQELFEPQIFYHKGIHVLAFEQDEWYLIRLPKKSQLQGENKANASGLIFEFYDDQMIWRVEQYGKPAEYTFNLIPFFVHDLGFVPIIRLQGLPEIIENEILFVSPFSSVADLLDDALLDSSNLKASKANSAYPVKVMEGDLCEFQKPEYGATCDAGTLRYVKDGEAVSEKCPSCLGSGLIARTSPTGTTLLRPKADTDQRGSESPVKFISPEAQILQFLRGEIVQTLNDSRQMMHLRVSNTNVQPADKETAIAQRLDQKAQFSFIKPISDQIFQIYQFILDTTGLMRYGDSFVSPTINPPINFDFLTEGELIQTIELAKSAGLAPVIVNTLVSRFINQLFFNERQTATAIQLITETDRLISKTNEEIQLGLSGSRPTVQAYEAILHDSGTAFINQLLREDENFFEQEFLIQQEKLITKAKEKAAEIPSISELFPQLV